MHFGKRQGVVPVVVLRQAKTGEGTDHRNRCRILRLLVVNRVCAIAVAEIVVDAHRAQVALRSARSVGVKGGQPAGGRVNRGRRAGGWEVDLDEFGNYGIQQALRDLDELQAEAAHRVRGNLRGRQHGAGRHFRLGGIADLREIAGEQRRPGQLGIIEIHRTVQDFVLERGEKESLLKLRQGTAKRAAEFVEVRVRPRIRRLRRVGREGSLTQLVAQVPGGESRVLVVVEQRAVILRAAALGGDADVGDPAELGREHIRHDGQFADHLHRWLTRGGLAEDPAAGTLAVEGEDSAVALCAEEFEVATTGRTLRDVGIEIEERGVVAAVARQLHNLIVGERAAHRGVIRLHQRRFLFYHYRLGALRHLEVTVDAGGFTGAQFHPANFQDAEALHGDVDFVRSRPQVGGLVFTRRIRCERAPGIGIDVDNGHAGFRDHRPGGVGHGAANGAEVGALCLHHRGQQDHCEQAHKTHDRSIGRYRHTYGTGLYRSTDGGLRWQLLYPAPPNVRFVAVTGDHADETLRVTNGPEERITALAADPADSRPLYAAMGAGGESTLRISTDWGERDRKST